MKLNAASLWNFRALHRLVRAHRILSDPRRAGEKTTSIAYDAGFGDVSYFNRVFRRHYGAAPSEIRAIVPGRIADFRRNDETIE